jgi:hypothetical protein
MANTSVANSSTMYPSIPPKVGKVAIPHNKVCQALEHTIGFRVIQSRKTLPRPLQVSASQPVPSHSKSDTLQSEVFYSQPTFISQ